MANAQNKQSHIPNFRLLGGRRNGFGKLFFKQQTKRGKRRKPRKQSGKPHHREILEKADFIKNSNIRLILQPMRNVPDLRKYLLDNGFDITAEALSREDERIYEIICAEYCGKKEVYSPLSLLLGPKNIENKKENAELFSAFCEKAAASLNKKICGMREGGQDASEQEALLSLVLQEKEV